MTELTKRILVAAIGIPAAFAIVLLGGWYYFAAILAISILALWEFYSIAEKKGDNPFKILGLAVDILFFAIAFYFLEHRIIKINSFNMLAIFIIASIIFSILTLLFALFQKNNNMYANVGSTLTGHYYVSISMLTLLFIRLETSFDVGNNAYFVLMMFCSIWICDSAAYFVGKKFGKHKLLEQVSPKKTMEGAIAGFLASTAFFPVAAHFALPNFLNIHAIAIGLIIGIFGQLGDWVESRFKRDAGVKDSSNIIPGHGGILDRFDSIIFVAPIIFIYLLFLYYKL